MSEFTIVTREPLSHTFRSKYPFADLGVEEGNAFFCKLEAGQEAEKVAAKLRQSAARVAKALDRKFAVRVGTHTIDGVEVPGLWAQRTL